MAPSFSISYSSDESSGKVTWKSPSNIALVKYWGKRERQLPSNPSLSMSLKECYTETTVEYEFIEALTSPAVHLLFNGQPNAKFQARITEYLGSRILDVPDVAHLKMNIQTKNSFPHSAGIASSASAFSSLALCLCSIEEKLNGKVSGKYDFFTKASYLSRLGSGSACRSVYGGYVVWGETDEDSRFTNLFGVPMKSGIHKVFQNMQDTILIVSSAEKKLSSSTGHWLMNSHPYSSGRYIQARSHINELISVLQTGDMNRFIEITENEALSLHALIMSSAGGTILLHPNTIAIIEKVTEFRKQTAVPVCFTIDAGPNIHLLYPKQYTEKVKPFILAELIQYCEDKKVIYDGIGDGPVLVEK